MARTTPGPGLEPKTLRNLYAALGVGAFFAVMVYFRFLTTGRRISTGPDHDLVAGISAGSLAFILAFLMLSRASRSSQSPARRAIEAAFFEIAGRLRGTVVPASWPQPPRIHFPVQGRSATLAYDSQDSREGATRVTVDFEGASPGLLIISHESIRSILPRLFGAQDVQIGDPAFDRRYLIQASPEWIARRLFGPEHRARAIESISRIDALPNPTIHLTRESLTVRTRGYLNREPELWALARTAVDVTGLILKLLPALEVAWGETSSRGGECRICGNPLESGVVWCVLCRTPHHGDCWKYNGRCAIYACGGLSFTEHHPNT